MQTLSESNQQQSEGMKMLELIQRVRREGLQYWISGKDDCGLLLDGKTEQFMTIGASCEELCNGGADVEHAQKLRSGDERLKLLQEKGRPIAELMWSASYFGFDGNLFDGLRRDDVIQLRRWPNFTRLPHSAEFLKIAALLTAKASSPLVASRVLRLDEAVLHRFYNASRMADMVTTVNRPQAEIQLTQHRQQGLISALFSHLTRNRR